MRTGKIKKTAYNTRFCSLADMHSGTFAPAFTLSFHDNERSRRPPNAHSLGR